MKAATEAEIKRIKDNGPTIDEFNKAVAIVQRELAQLEHSPHFWVEYLKTQLQFPGNLEAAGEWQELLKSISISDIQNFPSKYLGGVK